MTALPPASVAGGAKSALDGYEYQLGVSVLAALQLMLITKSASRITLEPANEEDLESDLEPATPGRVQPSANVADGYKLVVQVKLRSSGPWSIADFDALLKHGTTRRPAKHHLDDPGTRYLLITNADASGVARDLLVQGLEEWPEEQTFPASLSGTLPHGPKGRIAIWGVLTERLLDLEINDILGSLLRVPQSRQAECRARLRDEARRRMRGTSPGVWTREDLLSVIRGCGGYLASAQYVITSRTDMLGQAKADEGLKRWTVVLDADQYRDGELADIYDKRLELLATELQAKALDFRTDALEALETPFEIDLFFTYMADGPEPGEVDPAFFRQILALAHRDAVEGVVVSYLNASDQTGWSAIIWALLAARSQFDRSQLIGLSRQLRITDPTFFDGLEKLVNRLVATRHLRQPGQTVSFSHPSVRAGFEIFVKENWARSETALTSLISALTQLGGSQRDWALETAARSLKAIADLVAAAENLDVEFEADSASRARIDAWLEESLVDPRADFRPVLQLASDVGTQSSTPSELARWFIQGIRRGGQFFLDRWQPPSFDDTWYERVSADPRSFVIADRFVREQLPEDRDGFGDTFPNKLDRIATGLTPAFLAAARKLVASGFDRNVGAVAAGAVRDLDRYEEVLEAALEELARLRRSYEREGKEQWRAIEDGECDAAVEEGYQSQHGEDGYAAGVLVDAYVRQVRSLGRWRSLTEHPRISELSRAWADEVARAGGSVPLEELRAVIYVTRLSNNEDRAWEAAHQHWQAPLSSDLEQRILSNSGDESLRDALAYCALIKAPAVLARCFERLAATPASFVHLLVDTHAAQRRISSKTRARRMRSLLAMLPGMAVEIFQALSVNDKAASAVDPAALSLLDRAAETATPAVLDEIVPIMIASGGAPSAAIQRWLVENSGPSTRKGRRRSGNPY